jgi:hypothetical protein
MLKKVHRVAALWGQLCLVGKSMWQLIGMGGLAPPTLS